MDIFNLNGDKTWDYGINNGRYYAKKHGSNNWIDLSTNLSDDKYKEASNKLSKVKPITTPSTATTGTAASATTTSGTTPTTTTGTTGVKSFTVGQLADANKKLNASYPEYLTSKSINTGNFTSSNLKNQTNWNSVDSLYDYISNQSLTQGGRPKDNLVTFFQQYDPEMFNNSLEGRRNFTELMRQNGIRGRIRRGDRNQLLGFIENQLVGRTNALNDISTTLNGIYDANLDDPNIAEQYRKKLLGLKGKYGITNLFLDNDNMNDINQKLNLGLTRNNLGEWGWFKNGGKMTQKYQTGGTAPQGDPQQQLIQLVQAAMSGDQQASAQIQQIMQAAQQGDQQAAQLAEMIMQIANQMQGGAPQSARNGAKLNYIKRLKGECPEGYEMTYFKAGGKVCKKCQKKVEKACGGKTLAKCGTKFHKAGGVMESILSEMFAKGGAMNRNKHTAFGEEKGANVVSTNHAGRWGGRRAFNERGTHNLNPHDKPNKFTAFGDEGKKKPTNVGLVGHHATGKTGRMQNRQKAGTTYKATAFGGEKQKRFHRGAKASSIGRIGSVNGYPKGQWGKSGIGRMADGGSLNGVPFSNMKQSR